MCSNLLCLMSQYKHNRAGLRCQDSIKHMRQYRAIM